MNKNDFEILLKDGNIGFYQSCEVTQLFIQKKVDNSVFNFFIIASFEEKPFTLRNHYFLTSNKGIPINKDLNLGIQRYWLSIEEATEVFTKLDKDKKWDFDGDDSLQLGKLKGLTKQFVPSIDGQRINHILKNNYHNGSYVLEFFDESKNYVDLLLNMKKIKNLNRLSEKIKKHVHIDLSVVRDRIGNIIFQFPITVLNTRSKALSTWDGVELRFRWRKKISIIPDCLIQVESTIDKIYMGSTIVDYNKLESQQIVIGNLDQINHIKVWRKEPNLLLSTFDGTYIREFLFNLSIVSNEPRIFEINNEIQNVSISSSGLGSGTMDDPKYTTYINNTLYDAEKITLERTLSFKQYFRDSSLIAINDIRKLVGRNDSNGVYLWDPFLRSRDILKTLFYSTSHGVSLKAIGSIDSTTKKIYETKGENAEDIIAHELSILENPKHNNYGLNLEFRIQHNAYGWDFHDRFLIFPGCKATRPKVYSLGTSINSLGKSHHILQEVSHPQRVIDAFEELWEKLNHKDCLVWKYPKT